MTHAALIEAENRKGRRVIFLACFGSVAVTLAAPVAMIAARLVG